MRWQQLVESTDMSNEEILDFINVNCQPYIKQNPDFWQYRLWRGMRETAPTLIKKVHTDRKPTATSEKLHHIYDTAMKLAGIDARRSNSIFCTGNMGIAGTYGNKYVIFPIGDFSFSYSEYVRDMYTSDRRFLENGFFQFKNADMTLSDEDKRKWLKTDTDLSTYNEIMNNGTDAERSNKRFMFVDLINKEEWDLWDKLEVDMDAMAKKFNDFYKTTDIVAAINSKKEIHVSCEKYFAISIHKFAHLMDKVETK